MTAVTGYEQRMVDSIVSLTPGAVRDRAGNAILRLGQGAPARLVACPLDEPGYVVGGVRDDGYLTLHRVPGRTPPLADQQLEGQRVTIWGRKGGVPAVVAVRSTHLTRGRTGNEAPFTADAAYVDLGAATGREVTAAGVGLLDAVALAKRPQRYGDSLLAAPVAGRRASCAALIAAARSARPGGVLPSWRSPSSRTSRPAASSPQCMNTAHSARRSWWIPIRRRFAERMGSGP